MRQDSSGQTAILTEAIAARIPTWPDTAVGPLPEWEFGQLANPSEMPNLQSTNKTNFAVEQDSEMISSLLQIPYSIGYMDMGTFHQFSDILDSALVENHNRFVGPTLDTLSVTMGGLVEELDPLSLELNLPQATTSLGGRCVPCVG